MKAAIAVPSIRENSVKEFLAAWHEEFKDHQVIVAEDNPTCTFDLPPWVTHVSWAEIDKDLGRESWIIPRRSGAIRNYAMLLAARTKPDMVVMLDDDCLPHDMYHHAVPHAGDGFLGAHWRALESPGTMEPFLDTMHSLGHDARYIGVRPRGFPKEIRRSKTVVNHGLWNNIPDLDGETQLRNPDCRTDFHPHSEQVPRGTLFPLSAMNVAFRPEVLAAMYQIPMGEGTPFHRFDDIWCGWIMKKACDAAGLSVRTGSPAIWHSRASDAKRNAELEAPGILENERVWRAVYGMDSLGSSLEGCLDDIHFKLKRLGPYWVKVGQAAAIWRRLAAEALA